MLEYPTTLITLKIWQSLSFVAFFSSWKGGGFVVRHVAAKVIRQHMFFFIYILARVLRRDLKTLFNHLQIL